MNNKAIELRRAFAHVDIWEHEANVAAAYKLARLDPADPVSPLTLARKLLGRWAIRYYGSPVSHLCDAEFNGTKHQIFVKPGLVVAHEAWCVAHEIAECLLFSERHDPLQHRAVNQLAACIRAPRASFQRAIDAIGFDLPMLAKAFHSSQLSACMRFGEVTGRPMAIASGRSVVVRGEEFGWPVDEELTRRIAFGREALPEDVTRVAVPGERKRWALMAA